MKRKYVFLILVYLMLLVLTYSNFEIITHDKGSVEFYSCYDYDCSKTLVSLLNESHDYKCAFYDLDEEKLVKEFSKGGGEVLLFEKQEQFNFTKPVSSLSLMHHKFCVIDNYITLEGSWNPTERGTYYNDNYILIIISDKVAKTFIKEFERLKSEKHIGTKGEKIKINETPVELCFSPKNNCEEIFIDEIKKAKESIDVLAFSFTSKNIANELVKASERNVSVRVLFEKSRISKYSAIHLLNKNNISTYFDTNKYTMHEKMFIIDNKTAIVGSYNPSNSANTKNDEVVTVVRGEKVLKNARKEFERVVYS